MVAVTWDFSDSKEALGEIKLTTPWVPGLLITADDFGIVIFESPQRLRDKLINHDRHSTYLTGHVTSIYGLSTRQRVEFINLEGLLIWRATWRHDSKDLHDNRKLRSSTKSAKPLRCSWCNVRRERANFFPRDALLCLLFSQQMSIETKVGRI